MNFKDFTKDFILKYVKPSFNGDIFNDVSVKDIIEFIENSYEKPMSKRIAGGEVIDYDFFFLVNSVLSDLSCNR